MSSSPHAGTRTRRAPGPIVSIALGVAALLLPSRGHAQSHVYVTHASGNAVTQIDTATNARVRVIPVGTGPSKVAVTRDGTVAYVANATGGSVSVVDTAAGTSVGTIPLAANPSDLVVSPNGAWLYVMLSTGAVEVIDTVTRTTSTSIPVGGTGGLAITPDGTRVYVGAGNVVVIDTATNAVLTTFPVDPTGTTWAVGAAIVAGGTKAYITMNSFGVGGSGGVAVVDIASNTIARFIGLGGLVGPIATTPDGSRAYVAIDAIWADTGYGAAFIPGRTVSVIDALTDTAAAGIDLGAGGANWSLQNTARGLAVSSDRRYVYAAVPRLSQVSVADVNTHAVIAAIPVSPSPGGMGAAAGDGTVVPYTVNAVDDTATISSAGGDAVANVLLNDRIGGLRATLAHVTIAEVSSDAPGVALDAARAAVTVAPDTALGTYALVYRICEIAAPANCDNATATITVRAPFVIDAVNDAGTAFPGRTLPNVLLNDTLAGAPATVALVTISPLTLSNAIGLNPTTGVVLVSSIASYGVHTLDYRICEKASPVNCDVATVTVTVVPYAVDAVDDAGTVSRTGGTAVANVLANDRFNGAAATLSSVTLSLQGAAPAGLSLNTTTGAVTVAANTAKGVYTLSYRLCEKARADNCDTATVTVTVTGYVIRAVNDSARGSSKVANTPLASVLTNDTLGSVRATTTNVILSFVSLTPANSKVRLDLTDGSVDVLGKTSSGLYALVYRICERADPANCAQATVSLDLSGK